MANNAGNIIVSEMLELYHATTREQGGIDLEIGVFRRGTDHDNRTVLHRMEQGILLRARKSMNLIDEQDGATVVCKQAMLRFIDLAAQVFHRTGNCRDLDELASRMFSDDVRKRGLASAGRTVENHAGKNIVLDSATKPGIGSDRLFLPNIFVQRIRAHANGKRRVLERALSLGGRKQSVHIYCSLI